MHDVNCCIQNCQAVPYAPAGTKSVCKDHFLNFLTWRRRRGPQMFMKYAAMTMDEIFKGKKPIRLAVSPSGTVEYS